MTYSRRRFNAFITLAGLGASATPIARAQPRFPSKPINLVVPYTPGGTNDNVARIVSKRLAEKAGQQVVLDYKPGAGGTLGAGLVAQAEPDGYTLLNASIGNLAIAPQLVKTKFDPFVDLVPVAFVGGARSTVAVNPALPVQTLEQLVAYAKARPGQLSFATSGVGTPGHLAGEVFKLLAGVDIQHVPYKGSAPAVADVVAGHAHLAFDPLATPFVKSGKLRALAYFGGPTPPLDLPQLPSVSKAGLRGWDDSLAGAFFLSAPSRTPPEVLARLRQWLGEILAEPETIDALARVQVQVELLTPEQTTQRVRSLHVLAQRIIQTSNVALS